MSEVLLCENHVFSLTQLFACYGLSSLVHNDRTVEIPGSFWGAPEAGLVGNCIHFRGDTPIHSALHEASHFICMDHTRRCNLLTDAGGDDREEAAVCYLQVVLADYIDGFGRARCLADMDRWGYSFRFGMASRWFECDASDAYDWLEFHGLVDKLGRPSWRVRV